MNYDQNLFGAACAACVVVFHPDNKRILAVSRKNDHNDWGIPGGKSEPNETYIQTAVREFKEEIGIQLNCCYLKPIFDCFAGKYHVRTFEYPYELLDSEFAPVGTEGIKHSDSEESGKVEWRPFLDIMNGTFGDYNKGLLYEVGKVPQTCSIVLGAQFGDEGKGKLVDFLVSRLITAGGSLYCLRFNGGSNAGHTVKVGNKYYYTHLIPSGVICDGVTGILGNGVVVNIRALFKEINDFKNNGIDLTGRVLISKGAHITTLLHCLIDELEGRLIGTTKQGIGPTYADKMGRKGIRMDTLLDPSWETKLKTLYDHHRDLLKEYFYDTKFVTTDSDGNKLTFTNTQDLMSYDIQLLVQHMDALQSMMVDVGTVLKNPFRPNIFIEGANATMLDVDFGTYPFVTSSNCTIGGVLTGSGLNLRNLCQMQTEVVGVTKAYITRVGGGVLPTEIKDDEFYTVGQTIQKRGNEIGVTTGRIRRCGWLDLPQLKYSCDVNGFTCLNLTKLDVLSFLDTISVCVKYIDKNTGTNKNEFPSNETELSKVTPVYETLLGWKDFDFNTVKCWNQFPRSVKDFITMIESYVQIPVKYINTGQERDSIIVRE